MSDILIIRDREHLIDSIFLYFSRSKIDPSFPNTPRSRSKLPLIQEWDVSNVTNMEHVFVTAHERGTKFLDTFNVDISSWDVSNVKNMKGMFRGAIAFNQSLSSWDVSNVTNMTAMFSYASSFNQPLDQWNVSNVTKMTEMFEEAKGFNQSLDKWNVSKVTTMARMFYDATSFNQPLNSWNVSNVNDMNRMFHEATSFNQPLNDWDVKNVKDMNGMFFNAISFNQPLNKWNIKNVYDTRVMFMGATSFNQNLNSWTLSDKVKNQNMFDKTFPITNKPITEKQRNTEAVRIIKEEAAPLMGLPPEIAQKIGSYVRNEPDNKRTYMGYVNSQKKMPMGLTMKDDLRNLYQKTRMPLPILESKNISQAMDIDEDDDNAYDALIGKRTAYALEDKDIRRSKRIRNTSGGTKRSKKYLKKQSKKNKKHKKTKKHKKYI